MNLLGSPHFVTPRAPVPIYLKCIISHNYSNRSKTRGTCARFPQLSLEHTVYIGTSYTYTLYLILWSIIIVTSCRPDCTTQLWHTARYMAVAEKYYEYVMFAVCVHNNITIVCVNILHVVCYAICIRFYYNFFKFFFPHKDDEDD